MRRSRRRRIANESRGDSVAPFADESADDRGLCLVRSSPRGIVSRDAASSALIGRLVVALFCAILFDGGNNLFVRAAAADSAADSATTNRSATFKITVDCNVTRSPAQCPAGGEAQAGSDDGSSTILLGFLLPRRNADNYIVGALPLAVLRMNLDPDILPNHTLKFCACESGKAGEWLSMRKMTSMKSNDVAAFIGPDESCMSEAMLAAAWDLPMISYKCPDQRVSNKQIFPTFARTMPPSSKVSKFVISMLLNFKWSNIVIIVGKKPSWLQIVEALEELAKQNKIVVKDKFVLPQEYTSADANLVADIARKTHSKTRVYVFVADNDFMIDFARFMEKEKITTTGEYVIISVDDEIHNETQESQYMMKIFEGDVAINESTVSPFQSVLKLTPSPPTNKNFTDFLNSVRNLSTEYPFNIPMHPETLAFTQVPIYAAHVFDAVKVFAQAATEVLKEEGGDPRNITQIMGKIFNSTYQSIQGFDVRIDENGDAEGNFSVLGLVKRDAKSKSSMRQVFKFDFSGGTNIPKLVEGEYQVKWINNKPPVSEPECGFDGEKCRGWPDWQTTIICTVAVFAFIAGIFIFRYEHKLACLLWKKDYKDIILLPLEPNQTICKYGSSKHVDRLGRASFLGTLPLESTIDYTAHKKPYTKIGNYKGTIVTIKYVNKKSIDLTRNIQKELKQVRELRHDNINAFIGACIDPTNICILTTYCVRGSLDDVLKNEDLHLDNMFVASLVSDLLKGMIYLHDSEIVSHGNLSSTNCVVDSRWVLQITDFGLHEFKANQEIKSCTPSVHKGLLWRAPELMRMTNPPPQGSQKGDVYSFAIILHHVIARQGPWSGAIDCSTACNKEIIDIVNRVKNSQSRPKCYRPPTDHLRCQESVIRCMKDCWDEEPDCRPDFRTIRSRLKEMQAGLNPNIFDNMMAIMEKYALNLEGIVQERTYQLTEEKKKTETLLHRMLPKSVAESLKKGEKVEAESFDMVTIYFSDIVGFTSLSAESTPLQVVDLLNDLYTCFDHIIDRFDVYKVETIGDAYMVVSGLPIRNMNRHAGEIASMALALLKKIKNFKIKHRPGETLKLRIGIHSGPCVAGVVGLKMPRYCLFGDTVNTASRMESSGEALKIHVSEACKSILDKVGGFHLTDRGLISVKGKGEMRTFWLSGEDFSRPSGIDELDYYAKNRDLYYDGVDLLGHCYNDNHHDLTADTLSNLIMSAKLNLSSSQNFQGNDTGVEDDEMLSSLSGSLPGSPLLPATSSRQRLWEEEEYSHDSATAAAAAAARSGIGNFTAKMMRRCNYPGRFVSCSNVFQECKDNILKEVKRNGHCVMDRYKSAPIITNENFV